MATVPTAGWNTAFNDEIIKENMVFPTAEAWTKFVKHIHKKADGTMVVMLPKTTAMIVIFHIMTNSKLEYLQGMMMMITMMIMIMMMIKIMVMVMIVIMIMIIIMILIMIMITITITITIMIIIKITTIVVIMIIMMTITIINNE